MLITAINKAAQRSIIFRKAVPCSLNSLKRASLSYIVFSKWIEVHKDIIVLYQIVCYPWLTYYFHSFLTFYKSYSQIHRHNWNHKQQNIKVVYRIHNSPLPIRAKALNSKIDRLDIMTLSCLFQKVLMDLC